VQKFQAAPKTVTKVRGNGDTGSRFDGRHNGGKTVVLLHHPRFLVQLRKDVRTRMGRGGNWWATPHFSAKMLRVKKDLRRAAVTKTSPVQTPKCKESLP
jgi:hypothetical protein